MGRGTSQDPHSTTRCKSLGSGLGVLGVVGKPSRMSSARPGQPFCDSGAYEGGGHTPRCPTPPSHVLGLASVKTGMLCISGLGVTGAWAARPLGRCPAWFGPERPGLVPPPRQRGLWCPRARPSGHPSTDARCLPPLRPVSAEARAVRRPGLSPLWKFLPLASRVGRPCVLQMLAGGWGGQ